MKKITSLFLALLMLSAMSIISTAEEVYDGYAYGTFETGMEEDKFHSSINIDSLGGYESLVITVNFNPEYMASPVWDVPAFFEAEETVEDGKLILAITKTSTVSETEGIDVSFDITDGSVRDEEYLGFNVTATAVTNDGKTKELKIKSNCDIFIYMPVVGYHISADIKTDKEYYVLGEDITFNFSFLNFSKNYKVEYIKINFNCNKDVLTLAQFVPNTDSSEDLDVKTTDEGYTITFSNDSPSADYSEAIPFIFSVDSTADPEVNIRGVIKYEDMQEDTALIDCDIPLNKVYENEGEPHIILTDRYDLYRKDDILYIPHTVLEHEAADEYRASHLNCEIGTDGEYTDDSSKNFIPTGETLSLYSDGELCDRLTFCIIGDINRDGKVTAADARLALRHSAKLEELAGLQFSAADTDGNSHVTAADARKILRVAAGADEYFDGPEVTIEDGQSFVIRELYAGGAGYSWYCTVSDENGLETDSKIVNNNPPLVVGGHVEQIFTFTAKEAGTYKVTFVYKQSWNDTHGDAFELTVTVT